MELIGRILDGSIPQDLREALRRAEPSGSRVSHDEKMRRLEDERVGWDQLRVLWDNRRFDNAWQLIADRLVGPSANVAPLVAYLASEQAGWINGHVFDISGSGRLGCSSRCTRASPVSGRGCCRPPVSNSTSYPRAFRRCCTKCFPPQGFSRHPRPRRVLRGVEGR
jgi:hypothetical protein